jgi:DNA-binding MarR family transcriptional regulator
MSTQDTQILSALFDLGRYISSNQLNSDITVIQLRTLGFIYNRGKVKPTEIAKYFEITPASVTSQIDGLVEKGYLKREYNQADKRVIEVALTDDGTKIFLSALEELKERCSWIFETINEKETEVLLQLIEKVRKRESKK